jgi:hypothetical protein
MNMTMSPVRTAVKPTKASSKLELFHFRERRCQARRQISALLEFLNSLLDGRSSQKPMTSTKSIEDCFVSGDVKTEKVQLITCLEIQFGDPYMGEPRRLSGRAICSL